jgi:putative transposase
MCRWMEVSRSGFYEWRNRPESATAKRRETLKLKVKALFDANNAEYGYRRVHQALLRGGERCSPELVRRLMRELGLLPCQPRPYRHSLTEQDGQACDIPDLVRRDFTAGKPGAKMVGDITYIRTWQGWLYLATVIDCATRKIVGWAMDDNYRTPLIISAIEMAARNLSLPEGAVFHSDRGSNYTSGDFAKALKRLGIRQSVGRTGICYDNALSESVNGSLKVELVHRKQYPTLQHARKDIARWIELRYNRTRLHSGIGYRTPQEVMDEFLNKQVAA